MEVIKKVCEWENMGKDRTIRYKLLDVQYKIDSF